jgi:hypothetical protein
MGDLYLALLHHPVHDKNGDVVTTAVTNLDVHDIARLSRTFGVRGYYVCTPVETLHRLVRRIIDHWEAGPGADYNATRREALSLVRLVADLDAAIADIERDCGHLPRVISTSARPAPDCLSFAALRERLGSDPTPTLLVFGTGWGLTEEVLSRCHDRLEPIVGAGPYNHLSVRSAASIILDRVRGAR